jgi:polyhydroxybutyrate depolymerase
MTLSRKPSILAAVLVIVIASTQMGLETRAQARRVRCGAAALRPANRCLSAATTRRSIRLTTGGRTRTAILISPPPRANELLPLVVALHGGGGSGEKMEASTGFGELAASGRFAVVFPDGIDHNWNDGRADAVSTAARENIDDVGFITDLVRNVSSSMKIDSTRVFATGMSNGAMMTIRLACDTATCSLDSQQ